MVPRDERLLDLLDRYQMAEEEGQPISAERLCADCPELLDELRRQVALHQRLKGLATSDEPTILTPASQARAGSSGHELPPIPGYELLRELGRGGVVVVYLARQKGLNRLVALKMI